MCDSSTATPSKVLHTGMGEVGDTSPRTNDNSLCNSDFPRHGSSNDYLSIVTDVNTEAVPPNTIASHTNPHPPDTTHHDELHHAEIQSWVGNNSSVSFISAMVSTSSSNINHHASHSRNWGYGSPWQVAQWADAVEYAMKRVQVVEWSAGVRFGHGSRASTESSSSFAPKTPASSHNSSPLFSFNGRSMNFSSAPTSSVYSAEYGLANRMDTSSQSHYGGSNPQKVQRSIQSVGLDLQLERVSSQSDEAVDDICTSITGWPANSPVNTPMGAPADNPLELVHPTLSPPRLFPMFDASDDVSTNAAGSSHVAYCDPCHPFSNSSWTRVGGDSTASMSPTQNMCFSFASATYSKD